MHDPTFLGPHPALLIGGAATSFVASGAIQSVFNEAGLVMAIMGFLGGMTYSLAARRKWLQGARHALLGALLAFGLGVIAPFLLSKLLGTDLAESGGTIQGLSAAAYIVGFVQERIFSFLLTDKEEANG